MADAPNKHELTRMVQQHLDSLRAAGVEWLPQQPLAVETTTAAVEPVVTGAEIAPTFFGEPPEAKPSTPGLTLDQRRTELRLLAEKVTQCQRCSELSSTRTQTVFADGQLGAELCLIGEAPGADEDAQGLPFVGAAGQLLNRILTACGLKREEVYICNTIKCRPPNNRTPMANEIGNCREFLERQLELLQPKFICTLGGSAAQSLLGTTQSLGKLRRRFHDYRGIPVLCTYHPAFLLPHRAPDPETMRRRKGEVWEDMKMLIARMGRQIPANRPGPGERPA